MSRVPLISHASLDTIIAYRPSGAVSVRAFLAAATLLAERLPAGAHFLNLCQNRYRFAVGLAAGLLGERTSLQPASQSAETLRRIQSQCPEVFCLCDSAFETFDLPRLDFPDLAAARLEEIAHRTRIPDLPGGQHAITVYTSGSTGLPVAHAKTWGSLVRNARSEASRLGLLDGSRRTIVGTVPAQHMYGFESTVLLAMHGNASFWSGKPFFPQDIVAALAAVPPPRLLVTTPFHLATLLESEVELPALAGLLSATAPLAGELAAAAERRLGAPLYEIYGCSETGQLASRRPLADPAWLPLDGVRLERESGAIIASGGHIEGRIALSDDLELLADGRFRLLGRNSDLVSIAGKRSSLAYLNHQLAAVPGVIDGVFFQPDESVGAGVTRLCAFVVAPGLGKAQLLAALRNRIDAVFLPRPLLLFDALPRDATGKLPRAALQALHDASQHRLAPDAAR